MVPRAREYGRPGLYFVPNGLLQRTTICGKWHLQRSDPAPMQSVQNAAAAASGCSLKLVGETSSDTQSDADAPQIDSCVASAVCIGLETASLAACKAAWQYWCTSVCTVSAPARRICRTTANSSLKWDSGLPHLRSPLRHRHG